MTPEEAYDNLLRYEDTLRAFVEKYEEYQETHKYADPDAIKYFVPEDRHAEAVAGKIPYKFKSNGEKVIWPGYDKRPPGLYENVQKNLGHHYEVKTDYTNMLWFVSVAGYDDVWAAANDVLEEY